MKADGQRLRHRGFRHGHRRRYRYGLFFIDREALAETTLDMGKAHGAPDETHVQALVMLTRAAIAALVARATGIHGHPLTGRDARHFRADLLDRAGNLVPECHRLPDPHRAEAAVMVVMQVGAADPAGCNPDLDIARSK
jgi:hypothetical protein